MSWRIAFLGTFHPAVPTLRRLAERGWVAVVVLPEEAGAKNAELIEIAEEFGVPWTYRLGDVEAHDVQLVLAANYPKLVPARYLARYPCINTHWSLLPRYRGVHPTAWALLNGDEEIGVTVHWMEESFDTGAVLAQECVRVRPDMLITDLHAELAHRQADAVLRVLEERMRSGEWHAVPQVHARATYVPQRFPEDGIIHWDWPTERIWNLVRALPAPLYPGAFTYRGGEKILVWRAAPAEAPSYYCTPGQVVRVLPSGAVWVKTGDTCLEVQEVESGSGGGSVPACRVLRRGDRLGFDPQWEIARLHGLLAEVVARLQRLEPGTDHG